MDAQKYPTQTIMAALSTLNTSQFSDLTHSLLSEFRRQRHHLCTVLSSPTRFSRALQHLQTISLHHKTILIARYLLATLKQFTRIWETHAPNTSNFFRLRDVDATLLLMLLCEVHHQEPHALERPQAEWRCVLGDYVGDGMLTMAGLGVSSSVVVTPYIDVAARCRRFLDVAGCGGGGGKVGREVAASVAVVVALPSVEVCGVGVECVICREEMREGRDVCELPCDHLFHWICILPWLKKRNTCPCCRFQLPTDDVFGEIERLWGVLVRVNARNWCG